MTTQAIHACIDRESVPPLPTQAIHACIDCESVPPNGSFSQRQKEQRSSGGQDMLPDISLLGCLELYQKANIQSTLAAAAAEVSSASSEYR